MLDRRPDGLPRIGLALITKDEEKTLPRLLESLGWTKPKRAPKKAPEAEVSGAVATSAKRAAKKTASAKKSSAPRKRTKRKDADADSE